MCTMDSKRSQTYDMYTMYTDAMYTYVYNKYTFIQQVFLWIKSECILGYKRTYSTSSTIYDDKWQMCRKPVKWYNFSLFFGFF